MTYMEQLSLNAKTVVYQKLRHFQQHRHLFGIDCIWCTSCIL